jgi:hypothetical protein
MPRYDYFCEANGRTVEVEHGWSRELRTWGDLVDVLRLDAGATPLDAPVRKLIGVPKILRSRFLDPAGEEQGTASEGAPGGLHAIGCPCCLPPSDPGIQAFQQKLLRSITKNGEAT